MPIGAGQLADDQEISRSHARGHVGRKRNLHDRGSGLNQRHVRERAADFRAARALGGRQDRSRSDHAGRWGPADSGAPRDSQRDSTADHDPPRERRRLPRLTQPRCRRNCPASTARHRCHQRYRCSWRLTSLPARRAFLDDASEPVRLVFHAGAWRSAPAQPSEERL